MTNQNIANVVIAVLKEVELDGEMMEHIINEVGMRDQMIKQLVPQDDIVESERENLSMPKTTFCSFTRQQLINFTRTVQERCKLALTEAIENSGIDFDDMVELKMYYDRTISVNFDESSLYKEIESVIDDAFETDDEAVLSEALDVLEHLSQR
jgi:hypothetical protein